MSRKPKGVDDPELELAALDYVRANIDDADLVEANVIVGPSLTADEAGVKFSSGGKNYTVTQVTVEVEIREVTGEPEPDSNVDEGDDD